MKAFISQTDKLIKLLRLDYLHVKAKIMLHRIVRMEFGEENIPAFVELFNKTKPLIEKMPGCHGVQLFTDTQKDNVLITYSFWENEDLLNEYRVSPLFRTTWQKTKSWFSGKPMAWSMFKMEPIQSNFDA